ncbi:MAG: WYL domain-containing protein [Anaerolineae bacterium]|nr:WYL domain-containing protein [Anaerolineae bacterium]
MDETRGPSHPLLLLQECARCLTLTTQQRLPVTQQVLRLTLPDEPPLLAAASDFCIALLQAGGWLETQRGRHSPPWRMTRSAQRWLGDTAAVQLQALREAWWEHLAFSEGALPVLAFPAALARRWPAVTRALLGWVGQLPLCIWTPLVEAETIVDRSGISAIPTAFLNLTHVPEAVNRSIWTLIIWLTRGVLTWLGVLECQEVDGTIAVRPLLAGQGWLRDSVARLTPATTTAAAAQEAPPASLGDIALLLMEPAIKFEAVTRAAVQLQVLPAAPAACILTLQFTAALRHLTPAGAVYEITPVTLARGRGLGYLATHVLLQLALANGGEIPAALVEQLHDWEAKIPVLQAKPGYRLTAGQDVLPGLRSREAFMRRTIFFPDAQSAWVSAEEAPALWKYLRRLGYAIHIEADPGETTSKIVPVSGVSAEALWVLLGIFAWLHTRVPGLAQLPIITLRQALARCLAPEHLRAAQQLLETQITLLESSGATGDMVGTTAGQVLHKVPTTGAATSIVAQLHQALAQGAPVTLTYIDTQAQVTQRRVLPLSVEPIGGHLMLVAHCEWRGAKRHFRVDRIISLALNPEGR